MSDGSFLSELIRWFSENWSGSSGIPFRLLEHLQMSFIAVAVAALVALPLGLAIGHTRRAEFFVVSTVNLGRAIPSFGLLFLFVILFGIGLDLPSWLRPPILFALILLAIPPILTNTYVGVQGVEQDALEAARGMGLSGGQILRRLEVPLGAPLIVAGLRIAAVQVVATASLAAVVAGGGLGRFIVDGFATGNDPQIFGGALLVAALALAIELGFGVVERAVTPRTGVRERKRRRRPEEQAPVDYRVA